LKLRHKDLQNTSQDFEDVSKSGDGVNGLILDLADLGSISVCSNTNVSLLSPRRGPRVLDNVVVLSALGSVADSEHGVVDFSSALFHVGKNSAGVGLEVVGAGSNGDGVGCLVKGGVHLAVGVSLHVHKRVDSSGDGLLLPGVAGASLAEPGAEGVVSLGGDAFVVDDPLHGFIFKTTIASITAVLSLGDAGNKLLRR